MSNGPILRDDLVAWLGDYLEVSKFNDPSANGLQIEGRPEITRIAVAVDSSLRTITEAVESGADMLIAHHGLFWGQQQLITGAHYRRVRAAIEGGLNLYVSHLPLDAHPEVGNNAVLAQALGLENVEPFGSFRGQKVGVKGTLPLPLDLQGLADRIQKTTGEICLVHGGGPGEVRRVGIVSGDASSNLPEAAREGLDTFITGEPRHATFHDSFENGINAVYAGHYETETFGVRALAIKIEETFGIPWQFIHAPTGL
ncbi:dinuclear metal center YbgI/SA1388 family protein [Deinobacterium chartae]|uniref:GTP cyclohydrolase 1 type 2 homolog n=1 Tax=Deinobacterium chartae TaxID=521158 RepID=A0A841I469_9DEIO|nr:Nif3-like dinuclear metal center hexameric protein [Deinobacterium chartae]MBB6099210.1 dinuclear metal center YbgI/SA1388 family protein [Deinobacterium chartae]